MADHADSDPSEVYIYRGKGRIPRSVRRVEVDRSVKFIRDRLFQYCDQLESVLLHEGLLGIGELAFDGCSSLRSIRCPSTVKEIDWGAFWGCSNLAAVELPDGLESIESHTFHDCRSLREVRIPASVTQIGRRAFERCTNLGSVNLCEGLRMIGKGAFQHCRSLGSLHVPLSVDEIGVEAFDRCSSLALVQLHEDLPRIKEHAFRGCPLESFRFVPLSDRMEAIRMDDETKSMFESRLREITLAFTGEDRDDEDEDDSDDEGDAEAVREKCKESLGRAHEVLTYLELKGASPVLELALWKMKIEGEEEERVPGEHVNKLKMLGDRIQAILSPILSLYTRKRGRSGEDGGQDQSYVEREKKRPKVTKNIDQDTKLSREVCRFKCGADIVIPEVLKFFAYSSSWPRLDYSEEGNVN